jgi:hypothetical protein
MEFIVPFPVLQGKFSNTTTTQNTTSYCLSIIAIYLTKLEKKKPWIIKDYINLVWAG